jgi:hypothetical protein
VSDSKLARDSSGLIQDEDGFLVISRKLVHPLLDQRLGRFAFTWTDRYRASSITHRNISAKPLTFSSTRRPPRHPYESSSISVLDLLGVLPVLPSALLRYILASDLASPPP